MNSPNVRNSAMRWFPKALHSTPAIHPLCGWADAGWPVGVRVAGRGARALTSDAACPPPTPVRWRVPRTPPFVNPFERPGGLNSTLSPSVPGLSFVTVLLDLSIARACTCYSIYALIFTRAAAIIAQGGVALRGRVRARGAELDYRAATTADQPATIARPTTDNDGASMLQ